MSDYQRVSTVFLLSERDRLGRGMNALRLEGTRSHEPTYRQTYRRLRRVEDELIRRGEMKPLGNSTGS